MLIDYRLNKKLWDSFVLENQGSFLQSFSWGQFQKEVGKKVFNLALLKKGAIVGVSLIIKESFPLFKKSFLYIPLGPVFKREIGVEEKKEILEVFLKEIKKIAQKEKAIFLKIEPEVKISLPETFPWQKSLKRIQPQKTLFLDLEKEKEEIFKGFTYRVRYNIRLSERRGVRVEFKDKYISEFYRLMEKTAKINKFRPFSEQYYKKLFDFSDENFKVKLVLANYKEKIIASNILILFGHRAICLHGASDREFRALKAPAFLHWEQIKFAKDNGYKIYDFWGIDEKKWPGITFFKKSFGARAFEYPEGRDVVFDKFWYNLYKIWRKLKEV